MAKKPLLLMILDGFGVAAPEGNAIAAAKKPNLDRLFSSNPLWACRTARWATVR